MPTTTPTGVSGATPASSKASFGRRASFVARIAFVGVAAAGLMAAGSLILVNRQSTDGVAGPAWLIILGGAVWLVYVWFGLAALIGRLSRGSVLGDSAVPIAISLIALPSGTWLIWFTAGTARGWGIFLAIAAVGVVAASVWNSIDQRTFSAKRQAIERRRQLEGEERERRRVLAEYEQKMQALRLAEEEWNRKLADFEKRRGAVERGSYRVTGEVLLGIITWDQLEQTVASLLRTQGWNAKVSASGPDRGIDVLASNGGRLMAVQVKHWKQGRAGRPVIQQLFGAAAAAGATHALCVSSGGFSDDALKFIKEVSSSDRRVPFRIEAWDGGHVAALIDGLSEGDYNLLTGAFKEQLARQAQKDLKEIEHEKARRWRATTRRRVTATFQQRQLDYLDLTGRKAPNCDRCGAPMRLRRGRNYFWGCSRYPTCRRTLDVPTVDA